MSRILDVTANLTHQAEDLREEIETLSQQRQDILDELHGRALRDEGGRVAADLMVNHPNDSLAW